MLDFLSSICYTIICEICRCGGIGRHKGLKIPRSKIRTGSSPVTGTNKSTYPHGYVLSLCAELCAPAVKETDLLIAENEVLTLMEGAVDQIRRVHVENTVLYRAAVVVKDVAYRLTAFL